MTLFSSYSGWKLESSLSSFFLSLPLSHPLVTPLNSDFVWATIVILMSQLQTIVPPRGICQSLETFFFVLMEWGCYCQWAEVINAAKWLTIYKIALSTKITWLKLLWCKGWKTLDFINQRNLLLTENSNLIFYLWFSLVKLTFLFLQHIKAPFHLGNVAFVVSLA